MNDRKITIKIDPLGNPQVEAHGFLGEGCETATKPIEDALSGAGASIDRVFKDEWSQEAEEGAEQHIQW